VGEGASALLIPYPAVLLGSVCSGSLRDLPGHKCLGDLVSVRRMPTGFEVIAQADVEAVSAWHGLPNAATSRWLPARRA
jgi:hypothetical protein